MRVLMLLPDHAPHFGEDWAAAARTVVDEVVTVLPVRSLSLRPIGSGVAGEGNRFEISRSALRPSRLMHSVSSRVMAGRLQRCISAVQARRGDIDILHSHYYHQTPMLRHILFDIPHVHTEHSAALTAHLVGDDAHYSPSSAGLRMARLGYANSAELIAVSQYLAEGIEGRGLHRCPATIIPNPVDVAMFRPSDSFDPNLVIYVGRLSPEKGPDRVIRAFAEASRERPNLRLDIVGDGLMRDKLATLIKELDIAEAVQLVGRLTRDTLAERLRRAAVFVNASQLETFGSAVAEALACGVPVVAPRVAALPELINDGNGLLVNASDPTATSLAILEVLRGSYDRRSIADQAAMRFSHTAVGRQLIGVYERSLASAHEPPATRQRGRRRMPHEG